MKDADLDWFRGFLATSRWRFARTYAESYPHEYTLADWGDPENFWRAIECIERRGVVEPFWRSRRKYLQIDGHKYWHMGDPSSLSTEDRPTLINRAWLDVARYRPDAEALGYDEAALDELVNRWEALLERASQGA